MPASWAATTYALVTTGITAICIGLAASMPAATAVGGGLFVVTGLVVAANLSVTPARMLSARAASLPP